MAEGRFDAVQEPFGGQTGPKAGFEKQAVLGSSLHRYTMDKNELGYVSAPLIPAGRALDWPGPHRPNQNQGMGLVQRER